MPLQYKVDVLVKLKQKGFSTYRLSKDKLLGVSTITKLNHKQPVNWVVIEKLCFLLDCQPGDLIKYVPDDV